MDTPYYKYNIKTLRKTLSLALNEALKYDFTIHYAVKANSNSQILQEVYNYGMGADCVSANEVELALQHNISSGKIVFAGVGKTRKELEYAIRKNIFQINVESWEELKLIDKIAKSENRIPDIALRISPEIDSKTHENISTGMTSHKFGFYLEDIPALLAETKAYKHIHLSGLHFHIGSQILDFSVFENLAKQASKINRQFLDSGYLIKTLNMGGGLGVYYDTPQHLPDFENYFKVFHKYLLKEDFQNVHFELGRSLVANAGSFITKVLYTKANSQKNFLIVDGGMTDFIRPALYNAEHKISNISALSYDTEVYDIVGPICETSDYFARQIEISKSISGDLLEIHMTGAYGEVMSSNYNMRDKAQSVFL